LFIVGIIARTFVDKPTSDEPQASVNATATHAVEVSVPTGPIPKFRIYKFKLDTPINYVVSINTTDEQLKSLIWFFRKKVRSGEFKKIGINQPFSKQWGEYGYKSGILSVYRGEKCAYEGYISTAELEKGNLGACGYGEHDDGSYQWGIGGDPEKDSGEIRFKGAADMVEIFNYKDNWKPSDAPK
jgi:hypothetical protein